MEENTQHFWHIMLYYFKKGKNTNETWKMICVMHGEGAVPDQLCHRGLQSSVLEISDWMMLHSQNSWSWQPSNWDVENNQRFTMWEVDNIFKISKSIKWLVKMKNESFTLWKKHTNFLTNPVLVTLGSSL